MMAFLQSAIVHVGPFLLVISLIVTIHEFGHFLTAKAFGVAIDSFSIGFGPAILAVRDRSGVQWRLGCLPLGGYVKFAGDENIASVPDQRGLAELRRQIIARDGVGAERAYLPFKPLWQRALISVAGPGANFILAVALFAVFFLAFGKPVSSNRIAAVVPASAAARAGFQVGDVVVRADNTPIHTFEDLQFYVQYRAGVPIAFTVERGGSPVTLQARPDIRQEDSAFGGKQDMGVLGLAARGGGRAPVGIGEAAALGVTRTYDVTATTLFYISRIVTGQVGADQLHSFVGIAVASGSITQQAVDQARTAKVSWVVTVGQVLLQMAALLSVSVGILNLMPIPILDGGHLLAYAYEALVRRPPPAVVQIAGYRAGLALLAGLMLFATWNDLGRQRVFHFFGSLFS
jgi:regulator of sigma E protease